MSYYQAQNDFSIMLVEGQGAGVLNLIFAEERQGEVANLI